MEGKITHGLSVGQFSRSRSIVIIILGFTSALGGTWGQAPSLFQRQWVQPDEGLFAGVK